MPKSRDNTKPRRNSTEERLRASPFDEIAALEAEEQHIRLSTWQRMTEVKVFSELLTKPEFKNVREELKAGLSCAMSTSPRDVIYHVYSEGRGIRLELNEIYLKSLGEAQVSVVQGAVEAGVKSWGSLYWQAKGILSRPTDARELTGSKKDGSR